VVSPEDHCSFKIEAVLRSKTYSVELLNRPSRRLGEGTETPMVPDDVPSRESSVLDQSRTFEDCMLYFSWGAAFAVFLLVLAFIAML
jgi:hypothetical protein